MIDYLRSLRDTYRRHFTEKWLEWIAANYRADIQVYFKQQDLREWKLAGLNTSLPLDPSSVEDRFYEYAGGFNGLANEIENEDASVPVVPFSDFRGFSFR